MRAWSWLLLAMMLVSTAGCGGCSSGSSVADLKRRVIVDDEDQEVAAAPPPARSDAGTPPVAVAPPPTSPAIQPMPTVTANGNAASPMVAVSPSKQPMGEAVTPPPTAKPKTPTIAQATAHLEKIAAALEAYAAEKRQYPKVGSYVEDVPKPLVSWRVEILPYLGYEELYRKFDLHQSWDAPVNKKLLAEIPPEYQSLGATDPRTNYLAVVGRDAAFMGIDQPRPIYKMTDGATNCVIVVEANDERAVPWTAPTDAPYSDSNARDGLFARRREGVLAIVGGGTVRRIAPQATIEDVAAMFSVMRGDTFDAQLLLPPDGPAIPTPSPSKINTPNAVASNIRPLENPPKQENPAQPERATIDTRKPIPEEAAQKAGKKILAELYKQDYDRARTPQQKHELVEKLFPKVEELQEDAVGHYLLLTLIHDIAISAGDVANAMLAIERLATDYQIDSVAMQSKAIETLSKSLQNEAEAKQLLEECGKVLNDAMSKDDFPLAQRILDVATIVAKRANKSAEIQQLVEIKKILDESKTAYANVPAAQSSLKADPANADAHTVVGRYLCLYRRDWTKGLAHLAQSGDIKLKVLAQIDRSQPTQPQQQADLGDQWFELGADARPYAQKALELRAAHWYAQALDSLPAGLVKARVQKRLHDIAEKTGDESVQAFATSKRKLPSDE